MAESKGLPEAVKRVNKHYADSKDYHDRLLDRLDKNEAAYRAILERSSEAARWQSQLHPPWIAHIVETTIASLVDDRLAYQVKPRARFYNPGEYDRAKQGAQAHEMLMEQQLSFNHFSEIQRPFAIQALVAGLTVAKTYWKRDMIPRKHLQVEQRSVIDEMGLVSGTVPELKEVTSVAALYDGPATEVVNVRDFFWHEAAVSVEKCRYFIHRLWMSLDELEKLGKQGVFENVSDIPEPRERHDPEPRNIGTDERNRTRDMVEVLECWDTEERKVTWVAEQKILLRDRAFPFWHGGHPFVVSGTQPYPFQLDSKSMVEKLEHLQTALWDIGNQRVDNVRLLNNAITAIRGDLEDIDSLVYEPGARWPVEDTNQVLPIKVDPLPAEISLGTEQMLKTDMQNLSQSQPFTSTSEARNIGANTATEASLIASIGQSAIKQMKIQLNLGYERIGQHRLELNQQFIRKPIYVERLGIDNQQEVMEILPEMLQGEYLFDITPMNQSLMRQERIAEANAFAQVFFQIAQPATAMGTQLNAKRAIEYWLDANDIQDPETFFASQPPPQMPGQPPSQGQPGAPPPMGVTAPPGPGANTSVAAPQSPVAMLQRNLALQGGVSNNGAQQ